MESHEDVQKNKSTWKPLLIGVFLGILISILASVFIVFKCSPTSRNNQVDMYTGNSKLHEHSLWKQTHTESPKLPHTQWAIDHLEPSRSWYRTTSSSSKGWFGRRGVYSDSTGPYVYEIYSLNIPEDEKVKLLHQYHQDLDALKAIEEKYISSSSMEDFDAKWSQKLKLFNDESSEIPPQTKTEQLLP